MRKLVTTLGIVALVTILSTTAFAANRGVQFIDLGTFGDSGPFGFSITSDGTTVGGSQGGGAVNCIVWNESVGEWQLHSLSDNGCYMSRDGMQWGSALADEDGVEHMSRWDGVQQSVVNELPELDNCDFFQSSTFGISGDGKTLVGLGWAGCSSARAISSFEDCSGDDCGSGGVMTRYENFPEGSTRANRMNGANGDGSFLFGWQDTEFGSRLAAIWTDGVGQWLPGGGQEGLDNGIFIGEAHRSNSAGDVLVGGNYSSNDTFGIREGWRWTPEGGAHPTGQLPGAFFLDAGFNFAVSEDGNTTGGRFGFGPFSSATLWNEATGIMNLNQFLVDQGLTEPFDGWFMVQVNDMSSGDGRMRLAVWAANPDFFLGNQTVLIDITKVKVCHAPPGNPENRRTLTIEWNSAMEHVAEHGDFLGTCEAAGGGFSRAASADEHFGIDKSDECLQRAVQSFMDTHPAMAQPTRDEIDAMLDADCSQPERQRGVRTRETQTLDRGNVAPREVRETSGRERGR